MTMLKRISMVRDELQADGYELTCTSSFVDLSARQTKHLQSTLDELRQDSPDAWRGVDVQDFFRLLCNKH